MNKKSTKSLKVKKKPIDPEIAFLELRIASHEKMSKVAELSEELRYYFQNKAEDCLYRLAYIKKK